MQSSNTEWDRATRMALEAYESALRTGAENGWAVVIALTTMRTVVPTVTESDVRQALSIMLAKKRLAERAAAQPARVIASVEERA